MFFDSVLELVRQHIRPTRREPSNRCLDGLAVSVIVGSLLVFIVSFAVLFAQTTQVTYFSTDYAPGCEGFSRPSLHRQQSANVTIARPGSIAADLFNGQASCVWNYELVANDACVQLQSGEQVAQVQAVAVESHLVCERKTHTVYFHLELTGQLQRSYPNHVACTFDSRVSGAEFPPCDGFAASGAVIPSLRQIVFDLSSISTNTTQLSQLLAQFGIGDSQHTTLVVFDNFVIVPIAKPIDCQEGTSRRQRQPARTSCSVLFFSSSHPSVCQICNVCAPAQ